MTVVAPRHRQRLQPLENQKRTTRRKFFISYRRSEPDSKALADALKKKLEDSNHEAFIDTGMKVGTNWVEEIAQRIEWCDYLIVLLSEGARTSEMVQAEVRLAYQRRKRENKPDLLPVRVAYNGPLDYELDSYLGRIQYAMWNSPEDTEEVANQLLEQSKGARSRTRGSNKIDTGRVTVDLKRPQPKVDPRLLAAPGGNIADDDPYYISRHADPALSQIAQAEQGATVIIKAPRQMGKSSLLVRFLAECDKGGKTICFVDFATFADAELENMPTLLRELARAIGEPFKVSPSDETKFEVPRHLTAYIQGSILPVATGPLVIAFDEVDRMLGKPKQGDFFTMLREWHEKRNNDLRGRWKKVSVALVISTEPYLLIAASDRSPFNVTPAVLLPSFTREMCLDLNQKYGSPLTEREVDELYELVAGHPYLTRLALYRLLSKDIVSEFSELRARAADGNGPFGDHLRGLLMRLRDKKDLLEAMRQLVTSQKQPETETFDRLHGAGLVRQDGTRIVPANLVYARFFKVMA